MTLRAKLRQAKKWDRLKPPPFPEALRYVWDWFQELQGGRSSNGYGHDPLCFSEIEAWSRLTCTVLRPEEVRLIKRLDFAFLHAMAPAKKESE